MAVVREQLIAQPALRLQGQMVLLVKVTRVVMDLQAPRRVMLVVAEAQEQLAVTRQEQVQGQVLRVTVEMATYLTLQDQLPIMVRVEAEPAGAQEQSVFQGYLEQGLAVATLQPEARELLTPALVVAVVLLVQPVAQADLVL